MVNTEVVIVKADNTHLADIESLASKMELDQVDLKSEQFLVARDGNQTVGIGRLRTYEGESWVELATVGVLRPYRSKGVAKNIIQALLNSTDRDVYVTTVIPDFFSALGFERIHPYPSQLEKKVDFCKLYDFRDDQIFVMKLKKINGTTTSEKTK